MFAVVDDVLVATCSTTGPRTRSRSRGDHLSTSRHGPRRTGSSSCGTSEFDLRSRPRRFSARRAALEAALRRGRRGYEPFTAPSRPTSLLGRCLPLHARAWVERGRSGGRALIGPVRDHALSLAWVREGEVAAQAHEYDDLSAETSRASRTFTSAHSASTHSGPFSPHPSASSCAKGSTPSSARRRRRPTPRRLADEDSR